MAMFDLLAGRRRQGAVTNLPLALAANAVVIMAISASVSGVGQKTLKVKRLKIRNNGAPNTWVHIGNGVGGVGVGFVDRIPALYSIANTTDDYGEDDLPQVESILSWTAYPDLVGAGSFDLQIECEECG